MLGFTFYFCRQTGHLADGSFPLGVGHGQDVDELVGRGLIGWSVHERLEGHGGGVDGLLEAALLCGVAPARTACGGSPDTG